MEGKQQKNQTVLVLGAGMVAGPLVHYLAGHGYPVIVASRTLARAQKLIEGTGSHTQARACDVETEEGKAQLQELIALPEVAVVISMLPYLLHPFAAKTALAHSKHFLTTSYVSDAMRELEAEAKEKGLVIINECGVDPGTDHMSAMRVIHRVRENGGRVTSFLSYCGGLPAPDSNDNPFGYKYSWSPRGVLLASRNAAHFLRDGKIVDIAGQDLFDNFEVEKIEALDAEVESYPNRNSCQYIDTYGLSAVKTMIRGTYRYKGWCVSIKKLVDLGFLDLEERAGLPGKTYPAMIAEMVKEQKEKKGSASSSTAASLKEEVAQLLNVEPDHYAVNNMEWLGLFDENNTIPAGIKTRLDALCHLMQSKMQYKPGERDMILMKHEFIATYPDDKQEKITCMLIDYGISNGDTSMSRTVSLPVAIATRLVLEGKYTKPGLSIPIVPELYNPILDELETLGIKFVDTAKPL